MARSKSKKDAWIILAIFCVVAAGIVLRSEYKHWRTVQDFKQVEADLDAVATEVRNMFDGVEITKDKYCARDKVKFGGGLLRCQIRIRIQLGQNREVSDKFLPVLEEANFNALSDTSSSRVQLRHQPSNKSCFISVDLEDGGVNTHIFYCISSVDRPFYPLKD
jgi:hypothetical protein